MDKLYIIIPAYNEEANIANIVHEWYEVVAKTSELSRIVIINDGSKDSTYKKLQELHDQFSQMEVITKPNSGHGATILYGYYYALKNNADYIFQTDSDGQTLASEFGQFWEQRNDFDLLIGNRINRRDGLLRVIVTKILKLILYLCFHIWLNDANTPYRLMSRDSLKHCLKLIPDNYYLTNAVLSVVYKKMNFNVVFIPITFRQRQGGENHINIKRIFIIGLNSIASFIRINKSLKKQEQ